MPFTGFYWKPSGIFDLNDNELTHLNPETIMGSKSEIDLGIIVMRLKDKRKKNNKKMWEEDRIPIPKYKPPKKQLDKNGQLKAFVFVSPHCIKRFIEMMPEIKNVSLKKIRGMILAIYRDGCLFGGQMGNDFLILSKNRIGREVVFACTTDKNEKNEEIIIIKTTLSVDYASVNIQQREMKNSVKERILG